MCKIAWFGLILSVGAVTRLLGQDTTQLKAPPKVTVNGYVKNLLTVSPIRGIDSLWAENQIHNRLNFKWKAKKNLNAYLEIRSRLFWGDFAKNILNYDQLVDLNNDVFDLSWVIVDRNSWVLHTMIDRAYVEWNKGDWEVRLGRQRVNWGMALVWNPNDLFNAFSFFDFDYEERPGSDGIRIKKYTGFASSVEFASNITENFDELSSAGLWRFHRGNYDIQVVAGKVLEDIVVGGGWAGNIGDAGFKGELSYLHPYTGTQDPAFLLSTSGDYSFPSSLYLHAAFYINSKGSQNPTEGFLAQRLVRLNVRSLSPYKVSTLLQASYNINPLLTPGLVMIYYPGSNALFVNPSIRYSVEENLDLDIIGQVFFDKTTSSYRTQAKFFFFRLRWSY